MASIDDLFRRPNAPPGLANGKRKIEPTDADQIFKAAKLTPQHDVKTRMSGQAHVEEEVDEEDDTEAGPELPPDEGDSDEEGRFYGGGVTRDGADALNYLDTATEADTQDETIDAPWVRRLVLSLERKIALNARQRAKFESEPGKFMESEAELDAEIKTVSILTEHADLYDTFVSANGAVHLVSLLAHENSDIAINAIEIIAELIAEDVQVEQTQWDTLVDAMLDADLLGLLVQNFARFNDDDESDRLGVYHALSVLEALASQEPAANKAGNDKILKYLLARIQVAESPMSQNKQYAAEVLQVLLQSSPATQTRFLGSDAGIDTLLQLLSAYRKRDPERNSNEEQFAQDIFDALTCLVSAQTGRLQFKSAEGIELMLIMLRSDSGSKLVRPRALKVLDHALSGQDTHELSQHFILSAGLKPLFSLFGKSEEKSEVKAQQQRPKSQRERADVIEHCLGVFASLLRSVPGESDLRIRLLGKFVEGGFKAVERVFRVRMTSWARLKGVDERIRQERTEAGTGKALDREAEWLSRRLDAGLYTAQTADVVLAWLVAEDMGVRRRVEALLREQGSSMTRLRESLEEQLGGIDDDADPTVAEILRVLIDSVGEGHDDRKILV